MVEHDRKAQIPALGWAFVFGFVASKSRTLDGFRRGYNATADETLSPDGFHQRLTPVFAEYFSDLVKHEINKVAVPDVFDIDIDRFRDVLIADGTMLWLHQLLPDELEPRRGQGGVRLHLLHNFTNQTNKCETLIAARQDNIFV